jgi:hypothetical protein
MTEAIRARTSAKVCSMSGCDGGSLPVVNAAANLAVSHALWNWPTSGNMSGASRARRSVLAS